MNVLVGTDGNGHLYAYKADTFEELKAAIVEQVKEMGVFLPPKNQPNFTIESIALLPGDLQPEAHRMWEIYEGNLAASYEFYEFVKRLEQATDQGDFFNALHQMQDEGLTEFFLGHRSGTGIVTVKQVTV